MLVTRFESQASNDEDEEDINQRTIQQGDVEDEEEEVEDEEDEEGSVEGDDNAGAFGNMGDSFIDDDLEGGQGINSPLDHVNLLLFTEEALRALGSSTFGSSLQSTLPPVIMSAIAEIFQAAALARQGGQITGSLGPQTSASR
jgi:hypothetical protein